MIQTQVRGQCKLNRISNKSSFCNTLQVTRIICLTVESWLTDCAKLVVVFGRLARSLDRC